VNKLKKRKTELDELNQQFQEGIRNAAEKLFYYLTDYIENRLDQAKLKFQEIVDYEDKCDDLKERYIKLLFKEKRALPFLVEDRYKIIITLDKIVNKSEFISRYLQVNPFKIYPEIKADLKEYIKLYYNSVNQLLNLTILMETSFKGAYEITFDIERLRMESHNLKFKMLEVVFKKIDEPLRVNLVWKLISLIYDVISWCEETSDFLRGLIIKYPSR
jgi:uncharacterized protein Yka (UPF0111/DUF47 family)